MEIWIRKTTSLILIDKVPDKIFNASNCGDNCAEWLLRLAKDRDITINLRHYMHFGKEGFEIKVLNDDVIVHDNTELIKTVGKYV